MDNNFIDMIISVLEYTGYPASDVTMIVDGNRYHNMHKFDENGVIIESRMTGHDIDSTIVYVNDEHGNSICNKIDGEIVRTAKMTYNDKGLLIREEGTSYRSDDEPVYDKAEMQHDIHGRLSRLIIYATDIISGNEIEFNRADVLYQQEGNADLIHSIHVCHLREECCDAVFKWNDEDEPESITIGDEVLEFTDPAVPALAPYKVKELTVVRDGITTIFGIKLPKKK